MKKNIFIFIALATLISCSEDYISLTPVVENVEMTNADNKVTVVAVQNLINAQHASTRAASEKAVNIKCYKGENNDTLLYIYDKPEGGWIIYSSDARVPAVVAESAQGCYSDMIRNDAKAAWIQSIAEDMKYVKLSSDDNLNFTKEEIKENKSFWHSFAVKELYVEDSVPTVSRAGIDGPMTPQGHYELYSTVRIEEVYDSIGRLTTTNWDQGSPYNLYCPLTADETGRTPAGCVAIAGAQMLYFLHNTIGSPVSAPSVAYCNSTENDYPNYDWGQSNYSSSIWNSMHLSAVNAAPMIANVGMLTGTHYHGYGSEAHEVNLQRYCFPAYGILCDIRNFASGIVSAELLNGMPVILSANSYVPNSSNKIGHTFIADRYKRHRTKTINTYEWVWDYQHHNSDGSVTPLPNISPKIEISYFAPYVSMIGVNWGHGIWENHPTEWFSLTGDWIRQGDQYNWNMDRTMIYNFRVSN